MPAELPKGFSLLHQTSVLIMNPLVFVKASAVIKSKMQMSKKTQKLQRCLGNKVFPNYATTAYCVPIMINIR